MRILFPSVLALAAALAAAGCAGEQWAPPPPNGVTYAYNHQGFREQKTTVLATSAFNSLGGAAVAGAFSFADDSELQGRNVPDPFAESAVIDGVHFNSHLGAAGTPIAPAPAPAPSASVHVAPPSSAWVAPPPGSTPAPPASVTTPGGFL